MNFDIIEELDGRSVEYEYEEPESMVSMRWWCNCNCAGGGTGSVKDGWWNSTWDMGHFCQLFTCLLFGGTSWAGSFWHVGGAGIQEKAYVRSCYRGSNVFIYPD